MYSNFITKVHKSDASSVLPDLTFLMDKGNVTTYQWVYGEPPLSVLAPTDLEVHNITWPRLFLSLFNSFNSRRSP